METKKRDELEDMITLVTCYHCMGSGRCGCRSCEFNDLRAKKGVGVCSRCGGSGKVKDRP